jgi:hypothetical protein
MRQNKTISSYHDDFVELDFGFAWEYGSYNVYMAAMSVDFN